MHYLLIYGSKAQWIQEPRRTATLSLKSSQTSR